MDRNAVVEPRKPKVTSYWGMAQEEGMDIGQSEYIKRLTALRDSLIDQEQVYLAQALDRLRISSLANRNSIYRLRMMSEEGDGRTPHPTPRKNMLTTVEKFRQNRVTPHRPSIFPIQGMPLLEQTSTGRRANGKESGGVTSRSELDRSHKPTHAKMEESIRANLQRLLQPRSSIPNIGRKAIRQQEHLEVKPKSLANMRSRVHRRVDKQLVNPSQQSQPQWSSTMFLSPDHHPLPGFGSENDNSHPRDDTLDFDSIQTYEYDYYLVPPSSRDGERSGDVEPTMNEDTAQRNAADFNELSLETIPPSDQLQVIASHGREKRKAEEVDALTPSRNVISVFIPNNFYDENNTYSDFNSDDENLDSTFHRENSKSVSLLLQRDLTSHSLRGSKDSRGQSLAGNKQHREGVQAKKAQEGRHRTKQGDGAPAIILNPATPDLHPVHQNKVTNGQLTGLERSLKQREIRQKELQNLFEDVRELNLRTGQMTARSLDI